MSTALMGVVIPTNRIDEFASQMADWISNCLKLGVQVIVVVDKPDLTPNKSAIDYFGINDPLFTVITGDYRSPGVARNAGLAKIESKWVCFWDCDDKPNPGEMLSEIIEAESSNAAILIGSYEIEESDHELDTRIVKKYCDENLDEIFMSPGIWRFAFNRSLVTLPTFANFKMGEDQAFLASLEIANQQIQFSKVCVYRYKKHANGSLTADSDAWRDLQNTLSYMYLKLVGSKGRDRRLIWISITNQLLSLVRRESFPNQVPIFATYFLKLIFHPALVPPTMFVLKKKIQIEGKHDN